MEAGASLLTQGTFFPQWRPGFLRKEAAGGPGVALH
jgi:hypothetical protein